MINQPHIRLKWVATGCGCTWLGSWSIFDPRKADLIAALGETTGKPAFERVLEIMKRSPKGRVRLLHNFKYC